MLPWRRLLDTTDIGRNLIADSTRAARRREECSLRQVILPDAPVDLEEPFEHFRTLVDRVRSA
jgi:hypothetical protein